MATNLDVDGALIEELMRAGGFRTKREAVDAAVREALAARQQDRALTFLGTVAFPSGAVGSSLDER
jgi:Arc/MetJ family transcription regulator